VVGQLEAQLPFGHITWPDGQPHEPLLQLWPTAHLVPHALQLFESVLRFTQLPLQFIVPLEHDDEHELPLQTWAAVQAVEQLPQWSWLVASTTHVEPPQVSEPAAHPHWPLLHDWPEPQLLVQLPQC
jgi:hypothetical protein